MLLLYGKRIIEEIYGDKICNTSYGTVHSHAEYIYGDTDSVFISFKLTDLEGKPIKGKDALKITIELAKEAGELATKFLKKPHDLEYEKTFMPFALLSKKRYVGMLYEEDPNKCKRKSMGIVLKRRDNAPIVKDIYGGVIDILMEDLKEDETESDKIVKAMNFTRQFLQDMVNEKFSTSKLIISKSIRSFYKNPQSIAHKVLADRMGIRDSGNKPRSGDRIPFMYIQTKEKVKLQGDKIEHPDFIEKNKLKPDYGFYITNQIMKPLLQVFALVLYKMPEFKRKSRNFQNKLEILKQTLEKNKYIEKESKLKNKEVEKILFEEVLRKVKNKKEGNVSIPDMFKGLLDNSYRF
jgi:DNA polymerase elongation subunit (family B)